MTRSVLAVALALAGALSMAAVAYAGAFTETNHVHKGTEVFLDVLPGCDDPGPPTHEVTLTFNAVEHITALEDGSVHATFTTTGKFSAVPLDPDGESFAGSFTQWGGFNGNVNGATTATFTFAVRGKGDMGTRINTHLVDHVTLTPNGLEHSFSFCRA